MGLGRGSTLVPCGVEETTAGAGRFTGRPLRKPFRLQAGAIPIRPSFSPEGCYAAPRRVAISAVHRRHGQVGPDHDFRTAGSRVVLPPPMETRRTDTDGVCSLGVAVTHAVSVFRRPDSGTNTCAVSDAFPAPAPVAAGRTNRQPNQPDTLLGLRAGAFASPQGHSGAPRHSRSFPPRPH